MNVLRLFKNLVMYFRLYKNLDTSVNWQRDSFSK